MRSQSSNKSFGLLFFAVFLILGLWPLKNGENLNLYFIAAFLLFRLFDIIKYWPVSWAERLTGGIGVMADDLVAGLMAGIILFGFSNW